MPNYKALDNFYVSQKHSLMTQ